MEARFKRKKALGYLGNCSDYIHVIDVTQLYYTPELYQESTLPARSPLQFDHTYLLFCTGMLALIRNLAPLYTRGSTSDSIWRAASEAVALANSIEDRLIRKPRPFASCRHRPDLGG